MRHASNGFEIEGRPAGDGLPMVTRDLIGSGAPRWFPAATVSREGYVGPDPDCASDPKSVSVAYYSGLAHALETIGRKEESSAIYRELNAGSTRSRPEFHFVLGGEGGRQLIEGIARDHWRRLRAPPSVAAPEYSTIFLHLNVTGGAAFAGSLQRLYFPWESRNTESLQQLADFQLELRDLRHNIPFISWHSGSGWAVPFPADRFRIFTLARHPVARYVSFYNTLLSHGDAPWVPNCVRRRQGLGALVEHTEKQGEGNTFAKSICQLELPLEIFNGLPDDSLLLAAWSILKRRFFLVGITELFDASLLSSALLMGFDRVPAWSHVHTSEKLPSRVSVEDVEPDCRTAIESLFAVDITLYDEARRDFESEFLCVINYLKENMLDLQWKSPAS
jgi:hypothetical protein